MENDFNIRRSDNFLINYPRSSVALKNDEINAKSEEEKRIYCFDGV